MKNITLIFLTALTIISCDNKRDGEEKPTLLSNALSITDNEDKGVKEILEYYGGNCKYAIGASVSTDEGSKKYFELEMSKSDAIEKYAQIIEMPASNIAYLFYRNLKDEKSNYNEIQTVIIFNDATKKTFTYSVDKLELVKNKMLLVNKLVDLLKIKNFEAIKPMLDEKSSPLKYDKNDLIYNISKIDSMYGQIKEFLPYGFRFKKLENGKELLHISGALIRDKQSNEFSVDLDPESTKDEIFILQYKL